MPGTLRRGVCPRARSGAVHLPTILAGSLSSPTASKNQAPPLPRSGSGLAREHQAAHRAQLQRGARAPPLLRAKRPSRAPPHHARHPAHPKRLGASTAAYSSPTRPPSSHLASPP
eukprot:scaffold33561_cov28-Tisochrysis_lutea.AAC.1